MDQHEINANNPGNDEISSYVDKRTKNKMKITSTT